MAIDTHPQRQVSGSAPTPGTGMGQALKPLLIDVAVPLAIYCALRDGAGLSLWLSLAAGSVVPAIRSITGLAIDRRLNPLAALMLAVNVAGIAVSFWAGDPRLLIAKDAVISSVIGFAMLISAGAGRPLMSAGLEPFVTRGRGDRIAAWHRLRTGSARFRRLESRFTMIWGLALLADCAVRLWGALTLPVGTMAWLGTVILLGAIGVASMVGGVASGPMMKMVEAEAA
ncbi:MAG TPA: VC0807 family protein [Streptosporangiaceae bacterium]|nr:VC0807 family protein [Streptosporangiaceae bacterium]